MIQSVCARAVRTVIKKSYTRTGGVIMTNFDFLKDEPKFKSFADTAIAAERIFSIDESASVLNCRRAMEFAIKWMYSVDSSLTKPWDDKLVSLMSAEDFRDLVDNDLWQRLDFIRKMGNTATGIEGAGGAVSGKSVCFHGLCSVLLCRSIYRTGI